MKNEGVKKSRNPRKKQDLMIPYLPSEIIINIALRLPTRTVVNCKFVCKQWFDLLSTPQFVESHLSLLSKAVPCLALFHWGDDLEPYKIYEFVDELDHKQRRVRRWNMVFHFNLPCNEPVYSSANGLLFLFNPIKTANDFFYSEELKKALRPRKLFVCNPVTRDYITLPCPLSLSSMHPLQMDTYGFGVSRKSGQYKVVRIFHEWSREAAINHEAFDKPMCQVYSVGTGSWRSLASEFGGKPLKYESNAIGVFLNGNLHWLARNLNGSSRWISCFDLETELFSIISPPPLRRDCSQYSLKNVSLSTLGDCLCLCDNSGYSADSVMDIWLMKQYGDENSWTKEFVIRKKDVWGLVYPIKVFKNGDILMALDFSNRLICFSSKTQSVRRVDVLGLGSNSCIRAISYTPSLLSLKTFPMENVTSYSYHEINNLSSLSDSE